MCVNFDQSLSPIDLLRRLENLLRPGTIHSTDVASSRVRVLSGELLSDWLPWFERRAGDVRSWCPPSAGEQCLLLCPGGEMAAGMVLVGLFSDNIAAPASSASLHRTSYPDGAVIEYDHQAHALVTSLPGGGTASISAPGGVTVNTDSSVIVHAAGSVTIDSPTTTITGSCTVQGLLSYQGGMAGSGSAGGSGAAASITGSVKVTGDVNTSGDVTASGISLTGHTHGGVRAGGSSTGAPQ